MNEQNKSESLSKDYENRLNRLVEDFESRVRTHLNEEYVRSTKWSEGLSNLLCKLF